LRAQGVHQAARQHDNPVFVPLAAAHYDDVTFKVGIFHAQVQPFSQSHSGAIQKPGQNALDAVDQSQHGLHFGRRQDNRNPFALRRAPNGLHPR
jgi:hypothetical protein